MQRSTGNAVDVKLDVSSIDMDRDTESSYNQCKNPSTNFDDQGEDICGDIVENDSEDNNCGTLEASSEVTDVEDLDNPASNPVEDSQSPDQLTIR